MKQTITGYTIRNAMATYQLSVEAGNVEFPTSLTRFKDEAKEDPRTVAEKIMKAERALADLQTIQVEYNNAIQVRVLGEAMSLTKAVKLLGSAQRAVGLWRTVVGSADAVRRARRYGELPQRTAREKDTEYALPTISREAARAELEKAMQRVNALKAAVAEGNSKPLELDVPDGVMQ